MSDSPLAGDEIEVAVEATAIDAADVRLAKTSGRAAGGCVVGTVERTAEASTELVGARVCVGPLDSCGECHVCRRGAPGACPQARRRCRDVDGGLAGRVVARGRHALVLAEPLVLPGPRAALVAGPAALAYALLTRIGVGPGDPVITAGVGAVPGLALRLAQALGARPVCLAPDGDVAAQIAEASAAGEWDDRPRRIVCAGAPAPLLEALASVAGPAASMALGPGCAGRFAAEALVGAEIAVVGVSAAHPDLFPEVAAFAVRGELSLDEAAHEVGLAQADAAIADIEAIERSGKTLLAIA